MSIPNNQAVFLFYELWKIWVDKTKKGDIIGIGVGVK